MRTRLAVLASSEASNCQPRPDEDRWGIDGISRSIGPPPDQQSVTDKASPPSLVSLYLLFMSLAV